MVTTVIISIIIIIVIIACHIKTQQNVDQAKLVIDQRFTIIEDKIETLLAQISWLDIFGKDFLNENGFYIEDIGEKSFLKYLRDELEQTAIYSNNLSDHVWVKETEELIRHEQQSNSDNVEFSESFVELLKRDAEAEIIVEVWWEIEKVATDLYIRTLAGELPVDDARETLGKKMYSIIDGPALNHLNERLLEPRIHSLFEKNLIHRLDRCNEGKWREILRSSREDRA